MNEELEDIEKQFDQVLLFLSETIKSEQARKSSLSQSNVTPQWTPSNNFSGCSFIFQPDLDAALFKASSSREEKLSEHSSGLGDDDISRESFSSATFNSGRQTQTQYELDQLYDFFDTQKASDCSGAVKQEPKICLPITNEEKKAELIRIALEKLKEANIKKIIVKAYTKDGSAKCICVNQNAKIHDVIMTLFAKNHYKPTMNYSVVEYLPNFHMERIFEDHESLVDAMSYWSRMDDNRIKFLEKPEKYELFLRPEVYFLNNSQNAMNESSRKKLIYEFFQNIGPPVPEIEGLLMIRTGAKKSWKKHMCTLRKSGLYSMPKAKSKKEMERLFSFERLDLYYGINWQKEFKAPTNFCFGLKYPQVQKSSSTYMIFICCENERELKRWVNGIRIAKFGKQLSDNYEKMKELIEQANRPSEAELIACSSSDKHNSGRFSSLINRISTLSVNSNHQQMSKPTEKVPSHQKDTNCSLKLAQSLSPPIRLPALSDDLYLKHTDSSRSSSSLPSLIDFQPGDREITITESYLDSTLKPANIGYTEVIYDMPTVPPPSIKLVEFCPNSMQPLTSEANSNKRSIGNEINSHTRMTEMHHSFRYRPQATTDSTDRVVNVNRPKIPMNKPPAYSGSELEAILAKQKQKVEASIVSQSTTSCESKINHQTTLVHRKPPAPPPRGELLLKNNIYSHRK